MDGICSAYARAGESLSFFFIGRRSGVMPIDRVHQVQSEHGGRSDHESKFKKGRKLSIADSANSSITKQTNSPTSFASHGRACR